MLAAGAAFGIGFVLDRAQQEKSSDGGSVFWSVAIPGIATGAGTLALALATVILARSDRRRGDTLRQEDLRRDNELRRMERERDRRERKLLAAEQRASLLRVQLINPNLVEALSPSLDRIVLENLSSSTFHDVRYFYSLNGEPVRQDAGELEPSGSYSAGIGPRDSVLSLRVEFTDSEGCVWSRAFDRPLLRVTPLDEHGEDAPPGITTLNESGETIAFERGEGAPTVRPRPERSEPSSVDDRT